jgi:signal transduction histidine kinase
MATSSPLAETDRLGGQTSFAPATRVAPWSALSHERTRDVGIALLLFVAGILSYVAHIEVEIADVGADTGPQGSPIGPLLLIMGQTVPLIWRQIAPVIVLACIMLALLLFLVLGFVPSLASLGLLVALYTVAAHRPWSVSIPATVACGVALLGLIAFSPQPFELEAIVGEAMFLGAAWVLGDGVRERRRHMLLLEHRATSLEFERDQRAREAVAQERRTIARELHDVVAHNMSVMVAQATARDAYDDRTAAAVLGTIEGLGRDALAEMRRLTGLLRTDDPPVGVEQPGLDDIPSLVERVCAAGIPTTLEIVGEARPVSPGLALSAYRIVQEALTNVLKHAGAVHARVVIGYDESSLDLLVENDGGTARHEDGEPSDPGYGQIGMRERVALYGGRAAIGPRSEGGYAVAISLPIDGGSER